MTAQETGEHWAETLYEICARTRQMNPGKGDYIDAILGALPDGLGLAADFFLCFVADRDIQLNATFYDVQRMVLIERMYGEGRMSWSGFDPETPAWREFLRSMTPSDPDRDSK